MKKTLFVLTMLLPMQAISTEQDSVYKWGNWENGIQPAAGPMARVTPPPVQKPDVNFRPNENSAFLREAVVSLRIPAPPVAPGAPQTPGVSITTVTTPTVSAADVAPVIPFSL